MKEENALMADVSIELKDFMELTVQFSQGI